MHTSNLNQNRQNIVDLKYNSPNYKLNNPILAKGCMEKNYKPISKKTEFSDKSSVK